MNVYIHELSETLADRNIDVVVFTRRTDPGHPEVVEHRPGYRVVHIAAGPAAELPVDSLPGHVSAFSEGVVAWSRAGRTAFDVLHSHYWLSGWAGVLVKEALGLPLVNSFHTLGRVKDGGRRTDEAPASPTRTLTEDEVVARSDGVVASTPHEVADLVEHYGARPESLRVSPPGVDHIVFGPGDRTAARRWLGLGPEPLVLFAGRIEAHKGIDVAVRAHARLPDGVAAGEGPPHLLIVGGPSGADGAREARRLRELVEFHQTDDRVHFLPAQPHTSLAEFYRAADVLVMPSRSESFGLVAAEAQACGLPVVASGVGGLRHVVADGNSGVVVDELEADAFARALLGILDDPGRAAHLSAGAVANAEKFSWRSTARRLLDLYGAVAAESREADTAPRKNRLRNL
jgi:D-inositol-3-phosphate glycosyltransferase